MRLQVWLSSYKRGKCNLNIQSTSKLWKLKVVNAIYVMHGFMFNRIGCLHIPEETRLVLCLENNLAKVDLFRSLVFVFVFCLSQMHFSSLRQLHWKRCLNSWITQTGISAIWKCGELSERWSDEGMSKWVFNCMNIYAMQCSVNYANDEKGRVSKSNNFKLHQRLQSAMIGLERKHLFMSIIKSWVHL